MEDGANAIVALLVASPLQLCGSMFDRGWRQGTA
jgi:hypothetical protein